MAYLESVGKNLRTMENYIYIYIINKFFTYEYMDDIKYDFQASSSSSRKNKGQEEWKKSNTNHAELKKA